MPPPGRRSPYFLIWTIRNLSLWSEDVHGQSLSTTVDFNGTPVDFKLFPCVGERIELQVPEQLSTFNCHGSIRPGEGDLAFRFFKSSQNPTGRGVVDLPRFDNFKKEMEKVMDRCIVEVRFEFVQDIRQIERVTTILTPDGTAPETEGQVVPIGGPSAPFRQRIERLYSAVLERRIDSEVISSLEGLSMKTESRMKDLPWKKKRREKFPWRQFELARQAMSVYEPPIVTFKRLLSDRRKRMTSSVSTSVVENKSTEVDGDSAMHLSAIERYGTKGSRYRPY